MYPFVKRDSHRTTAMKSATPLIGHHSDVIPAPYFPELTAHPNNKEEKNKTPVVCKYNLCVVSLFCFQNYQFNKKKYLASYF